MDIASQAPRDLKESELLTLLFEYQGKIAGERSLDNLLILMANLGRELVVADRCTLWLLDSAKSELWTKVAHGVDELRMPAQAGFVGSCIQSGKTIRIEDAYDDVRFNPEMDRKTQYRTRSVLAIPIFDSEGQPMGAFQSINKLTEHGVFTDSDEKHLSLTAVYSGKSLETAILLHELESTMREVAFTLGEVGEMRSRETGYHVRRVAEYCGIICRYLGMDSRECEMVKNASPLHDIGKIAIPDSILKKPGRLTIEEFEEMKAHTIYGYNMLRHSVRKLMQAAATIAYTHQEKFNGTGYPRGLAGEEIPLYGRICAVADVFDALSNDRCYKKAWPIEKVLQYFREESGQHFDPSLVQILLEYSDEFLSINHKFRDADLPQK